MIADLPHTLYKDKNKVSTADVDDAARKTMEAMERKRKTKMEAGEPLTIDEVFNTSN